MKKIVVLFFVLVALFYSCKLNPGGGSKKTYGTIDMSSPEITVLGCNSTYITQQYKYVISVFTYDENNNPMVYSRTRIGFTSDLSISKEIELPSVGQYFYEISVEGRYCQQVSDATDCNNWCAKPYYYYASKVFDSPFYREYIYADDWESDGYDCCN